jgi:hypothetical protein
VGESQRKPNDTHDPTDFSPQHALRLLLHSVNGNALDGLTEVLDGPILAGGVALPTNEDD